VRSPDYIFRYTRAEIEALVLRAQIRATGFYAWPAQIVITRTAGHAPARLGRGHMISGYGTTAPSYLALYPRPSRQARIAR